LRLHQDSHIALCRGGRLSAASNPARHREAQTHMPFSAQIISLFQLKRGQKSAEKNCEWQGQSSTNAIIHRAPGEPTDRSGKTLSPFGLHRLWWASSPYRYDARRGGSTSQVDQR